MWRWIVAIILSFILCGCVSDDYAPVESGRLQLTTKSGFYRVKAGDTLYSIAWAFNRDYRTLALMNHLPPPYRIEPGQRLQINTQVKSLAAPVQWQPVRMVSYPAAASAPHYVAASPSRPIYSYRLPSPPPTRAVVVMRPPLLRAVKNWLWPAQGKVVSGFSRMLGGNQGIDIKGRYGESVYAAANGIVVYSGAGVRGYGNLIIVKHNASYLSAYAFNRRILVKDGSRVRAGQKIAEMGRNDSGRVLLHFEIRRNGTPVNPLRYLS